MIVFVSLELTIIVSYIVKLDASQLRPRREQTVCKKQFKIEIFI